MQPDYPLRLRPILQEYLWGGRRLGTLLGKPIGDGPTYAESWEVVDHPDGRSVVENGPLAGKTLGDLARESPAAVYGGRGPYPERFPLLFKYLDAQRTLSVQVHPNDRQAALLDPPDLGKTEAWLVVAADPGGKIYAGLRAGVTRDALAEAVARGGVEGGVEGCLHAFEPRPGDCVFIPAGTVHALGAGLVIAEIQQASNTTYRLYDWNRLDRDGRPRPLHVEQSLEVTDFARGPVAAQVPTLAGDWERLVECDKFVFERWRSAGPGRVGVAASGGFTIVSLVDGAGVLACGPSNEGMAPGTTLLLPAAAPAAEFRADAAGATLVAMRLP